MGVCKLFLDGEMMCRSIDSGKTISERVNAVSDVIRYGDTHDCVGICIEQPFGANARSLQVLYAMMGAAVLECEHQCVPWSLIHLTKIKKHATGKGNAKKPDMQAAAKERWGVDLSEDESDAAWIAAYALDNKLFS